jgi:hypothetical protein
MARKRIAPVHPGEFLFEEMQERSHYDQPSGAGSPGSCKPHRRDSQRQTFHYGGVAEDEAASRIEREVLPFSAEPV